jgi:hypothetical protein
MNEIHPYFGAEQQQEEERAERLRQDGSEAPEREVAERDLEEQRLAGPEQQDHEAHAPGQHCQLCGAVITTGQDVRRRRDGNWVHEVCPLDLG